MIIKKLLQFTKFLGVKEYGVQINKLRLVNKRVGVVTGGR